LASAFVLQLSFHLLGYHKKIVAMFNTLKMPDMIESYDALSSLICKDLGKPPVKIVSMAESMNGNKRLDIRKLIMRPKVIDPIPLSESDKEKIKTTFA
jgi:hypothetical protein